jgi:decaprenylphospho-beta-D-erythro-pentofuranosid-2-ulose 2-reductase
VNVVVLGATRGIGRAVARRYAERGDCLLLLGRHQMALERTARDLEIRGAARSVNTVVCDLLAPATFADAIERVEQLAGRIECLVVTAGLFAPQEELEGDADLLEKVLQVDFTNTILFCELARKRMLAGGGGTLCVLSSVAGDRARKSVVLYGAAKAGLSYYLEGLDHRFHRMGLRTVCVKPGFVKTGMTDGVKPPPFAGEPDRVARVIVKAIDRGWPEVYAPRVWSWVMLVVRNVPRFVMRRIGF